jgi:hypothetical protein
VGLSIPPEEASKIGIGMDPRLLQFKARSTVRESMKMLVLLVLHSALLSLLFSSRDETILLCDLLQKGGFRPEVLYPRGSIKSSQAVSHQPPATSHQQPAAAEEAHRER